MDTSVTEQSPAKSPSSVPAFVLTHLDMYNWGAFAARHCAVLDSNGTAIVGSTGSGKTTVVDALMTLIVATPRYNLASTGGIESDRDLVSYVRGVSGPGNASGDNQHIARPGKTVSALAARFSNGEQEVTIAGLFALDGTSSALSDLRRLWIFSQATDQTLDGWLTLYHESGARALKQLARETPQLVVYDSKTAYLVQLRRFFEVGDNAFALLNRAVGLKQLDSVDEIFRELVLDDTSAFERAAEVAREFDDLAAIHEELERARDQQRSLLPVAERWDEHQRIEEDLRELEQLHSIAPVWYATHAHRLWIEHGAQMKQRTEQYERAFTSLQQQIDNQIALSDSLRDLYLQAGGASIEQLRDQITLQSKLADERRRYSGDYQRLARRLQLDDTLSEETVVANRQQARDRIPRQREQAQSDRTAAFAAGVVSQRHEEELEALRKELSATAERPGSNIPPRYHHFRAEMAAHLQLSESALGFAAELIEVKAKEAAWRGAIERALRGERLRLLVPTSALHRALAWVKSRDNRLHVRLLQVLDDRDYRNAVEFFSDSFTRKLNFKQHASKTALLHLLAGIDRHCVDNEEQLERVSYGLTVEGLESGRRGYFDKRDDEPLDRNWMTGFDNRDRLARIQQQIREAEDALAEGRRGAERASKLAEESQVIFGWLEQIIQVEFALIDLPGAQMALDSLQERLAAHTAPDSDAEQARLKWAAAYEALGKLREEARNVDLQRKEFETHWKTALEAQERAFRRVGEGLTDQQWTLATQHLGQPDIDELKDIDDLERTAIADLQRRIDEARHKRATVAQNLIRLMEQAKKIDSGALSEVRSMLADIQAYMDRLRVLTEEALPEKLNRFLTYLNQSSDEGVTQLLSHIENEVSAIEERIEDLNRTLRRVSYAPGTYLRLQPEHVVHESLRTLQQALRHLRSASFKEDQGESHFKALRHVVDLVRQASDNRKTQGARALLDPRYRLQFSVSVIAAETGATLETRTSSQGGSGGEKEIIASYVLTASLSYALCPDGGNRPLFGTIVLDEAFSKSSHAIAGRIISALEEFGLHPLFVTPNKEMRLLRMHTRTAILVHRKGQRATLTSLSWEELENLARARNRPAQ
ncbi:MAG: ATP-binding protein [Steroidobacteraceae bacterium]